MQSLAGIIAVMMVVDIVTCGSSYFKNIQNREKRKKTNKHLHVVTGQSVTLYTPRGGNITVLCKCCRVSHIEMLSPYRIFYLMPHTHNEA